MTLKIDWANTEVEMEYEPSFKNDTFNPTNILEYEIVFISYGGTPCPELKEDIYKILVSEILNN